ncbi:hypothetical protein RYD26_12255 [Pasteurellaceae bacterium LIM206]|nr:hypothetical protein [Pasteurellaceae bacterium LIM206]
MKVINKMFFPLIIFMALGNVYLFYDGYLNRTEMQRNRKEVFSTLDRLFGTPLKIEDFSRDNGYAFLHFSSENKKNYHDKLLSEGYVFKHGVYCHKKGALTLTQDRKLVFLYKYPVKMCQ